MNESERPNVNTGGGPYVAGDVQATGDFIGRDKIAVTVSFSDKESITLRRSAIHPVTLAGKNLQIRWMIIFGALGLVAGLIVNIYLLLHFLMNTDYVLVTLILILCSAATFLGGILVHTGRFMHVWGINLECDAQGRIYRTKIEGFCPRCGSYLKIRNVGASESKKIMLICNRNPIQHRWDFDFTSLPELQGQSPTLPIQ